MSENKTAPTDVSPEDFIERVENATRREDAWRLLEMHCEITGHEPVMWGPSIIGFDSYHYVYASGREGDAAAAGFSPRSANLVLYVALDFEGADELLARLGKHKTSKACLYITRLAQVDEDVLRELIARSYAHVKEIYDDPAGD